MALVHHQPGQRSSWSGWLAPHQGHIPDTARPRLLAGLNQPAIDVVLAALLHLGTVTSALTHADVAQLEERDLAKVEVAGSSPVVRSIITPTHRL